jgi:anti-sigma regulatory factor (Ser/Thr protein kinase)
VTEKCEITREARLENLPALLHFISGACESAGASAGDQFAVKLAVEEACVNVITHGYAGREPGPISLTFRSDSERFVVTVADAAAPFEPEALPEPDLTSGWKERKIGGLGWWLIRKMVDGVEYESSPGGGNRLTLVKRRDRSLEESKGDSNAD